MSCSTRLVKKAFGGHARPGRMSQRRPACTAAEAHPARARRVVEAAAVRVCALRRRARPARAATPRASAAVRRRDSRRRHPCHLFVDHGGDRHRPRPRDGLRHDAVAERAQRRPFLVGEEPMLVGIDGEPPIDDAPRLLVPRRRVALGEHIVAGIAVSSSVPSPRSARARRGRRAPGR